MINTGRRVGINNPLLSQIFIFFTMAQQPLVGQGLPLSRLHDHTQTHYARWNSSGRVISRTQEPVPVTTQHPQESDIYNPGGIRTRSPNKRAAADPRSRWPCALRRRSTAA